MSDSISHFHSPVVIKQSLDTLAKCILKCYCEDYSHLWRGRRDSLWIWSIWAFCLLAPMPRPMSGGNPSYRKEWFRNAAERKAEEMVAASQHPHSPCTPPSSRPLADHWEETVQWPSCSMWLLKLFPERHLQIYCEPSMPSVAEIVVPQRYSQALDISQNPLWLESLTPSGPWVVSKRCDVTSGWRQLRAGEHGDSGSHVLRWQPHKMVEPPSA